MIQGRGHKFRPAKEKKWGHNGLRGWGGGTTGQRRLFISASFERVSRRLSNVSSPPHAPTSRPLVRIEQTEKKARCAINTHARSTQENKKRP